MPRSNHRLDLDERRTIVRLHDVKVAIAVIAAQLGRHRAVIHHEIWDFSRLGGSPACCVAEVWG